MQELKNTGLNTRKTSDRFLTPRPKKNKQNGKKYVATTLSIRVSLQNLRTHEDQISTENPHGAKNFFY